MAITLAWFLLPASAANDPALESKVNSWMQNPKGLRFLENKGQMVDLEDGYSPVENRAGKCVADMNLLFKISTAGLDMYITKHGLSYVFTRMEKSKIPELNSSAKSSGWNDHLNESVSVHYCRADMELVGAEIKQENILREYESEDRTDYYLEHCPQGILNVHSYEKITIRNVYHGIDWVLYEKNEDLGIGNQESGFGIKSVGGIKYDFVVHPGADPSLIKLRYKWTDRPSLQKDGSVKITTPMGSIVEGRPFSYHYGHEHRQEINTRYFLKDDEISFALGKYNQKDTLIIDPSLVWATYSGGNDIEDVYSINSDGKNVWVTGSSESAGFPTFNPPGGKAYFMGTYSGGLMMDIIIIEFSICGQRIWATYYGGSMLDVGNSISSDGVSVWVTGQTASGNFPTQISGTAYSQGALGGGFGTNNAFILQFSCTTNARLWASYYGGSSSDGGNSISSDGSNVWVTGQTQSTNFPTFFSGGTYKQTALGGVGTSNAFILQFSCSTSALVWATYYGRSGMSTNGGDIGYSINSDGKNVWVTGQTQSTDFPTLFPVGAYKQVALGGVSGNTNVFILQFSCAAGALVWASYYGGSSADQGKSINSDGINVWITGQAKSTDFPLQNPGGGTYMQTLPGGTYNPFVLQFNCATGSCIWATYYGGSNITGTIGAVGDIGYSIQSDRTNVWVCGSTSSTGFPIKGPVCGFYQNTLKGGSADVFILQFTTSGVLRWATYYGADSENDGSYISSDGTNLFVSGDAELNGYPTVNPGGLAYYKTTIAGTENIFMAKFSISCLAAGPDTAFCSGGSTQLYANGGTNYIWSPPAGLNSTVISRPAANPIATTTYTVTSSDACGATSTATATITVNPIPDIQITPSSPQITCASASVTLMGKSTSTGVNYQWIGGPGMADYAVSIADSYTLVITDPTGNCTATQTVTVRNNTAIPPVTAASSNDLSCAFTNSTLTGTSGAGVTMVWNGGTLTGAANPASVAASGTYTVTATDTTNGCAAISTVTVLGIPGPGITIEKITNTCKDKTDGAIALTVTGTGLIYTWSNGNSGLTASDLTPGIYSITVTDGNGCMETTVVTVTQFPVPVINAGTNETILKGQSVQLTSGGGNSYLWKPSAGLTNSGIADPVASPNQTTNYVVTVTDGNNCSSKDSVWITVISCEASQLFMPTGFSPNGDGENDILYLRVPDCVTQMNLSIYDRWGQQVFETTTAAIGWDGTFGGRVMNTGVFTYYLSITLENGEEISKKGNITLLR